MKNIGNKQTKLTKLNETFIGKNIITFMIEISFKITKNLSSFLFDLELISPTSTVSFRDLDLR
jgi:hypothetical protein